MRPVLCHLGSISSPLTATSPTPPLSQRLHHHDLHSEAITPTPPGDPLCMSHKE